MRISDWSSDVCSSDLLVPNDLSQLRPEAALIGVQRQRPGIVILSLVPLMPVAGPVTLLNLHMEPLVGNRDPMQCIEVRGSQLRADSGGRCRSGGADAL